MTCLRIFGLALAVLSVSACAKKTLPPVPDPGAANVACERLAPWGFPQVADAEPKPQEGRRRPRKSVQSIGFVCHSDQFALAYDQSLRVPRWTVEIASASRIQGEPARVRKDWRIDPFLPPGVEVSPADYSKELTQGRVGVKAFVSHKNYANDEVAVGRTFYLSNTAPALRKDEAPGAWEKLEDQVVRWSVEKGDLMVISGPIFLNGTPLGWAGHKQKKRRSEEARGVVAVPTHFYKVIVDMKTQEAIAFQIPNDDSPSSALAATAKRVSDIEAAAGLRFFPSLPEEERSRLVNSVYVLHWTIK